MLKLLFEEETPLREEGAAKLILPRTARDLLRSRVGAEVIDDFKITKPIYQAIRKVPQWDRESAPFYTITHSSHGEMTIGDLRVRGHAGPYEDEPVEAAVEHYWERLATGNADFWYGAGVAGSVFQDRSLVFNVDNIPSLLDQFVEGEGITSKTSFIGVWGSSFPWHSEDMRLWSANVLLYGAPKYWYVLPASQSQKLEELADAYAYESANCTHYMMHKRSQICPSFLSRRGFTPRTTVHTQGEIMVVAPNAYHMGFNLGLNIAESKNFATHSWIKDGKEAKSCSCRGRARAGAVFDMGPFSKLKPPRDLYQPSTVVKSRPLCTLP
nr:PREDICTED: lysine-specific demethylase 4E-like [Bemisia tabaci]XP_018917662.1 PREDICTED: lysine-specific demethylase 4E-like [Bemisia tabaci]